MYLFMSWIALTEDAGTADAVCCCLLNIVFVMFLHVRAALQVLLYLLAELNNDGDLHVT